MNYSTKQAPVHKLHTQWEIGSYCNNKQLINNKRITALERTASEAPGWLKYILLAKSSP